MKYFIFSYVIIFFVFYSCNEKQSLQGQEVYQLPAKKVYVIEYDYRFSGKKDQRIDILSYSELDRDFNLKLSVKTHKDGMYCESMFTIPDSLKRLISEIAQVDRRDTLYMNDICPDVVIDSLWIDDRSGIPVVDSLIAECRNLRSKLKVRQDYYFRGFFLIERLDGKWSFIEFYGLHALRDDLMLLYYYLYREKLDLIERYHDYQNKNDSLFYYLNNDGFKRLQSVPFSEIQYTPSKGYFSQ